MRPERRLRATRSWRKVKALLARSSRCRRRVALPPLAEARLLAKQYRREGGADPTLVSRVGELLEQAKRLKADPAAVGSVRISCTWRPGTARRRSASWRR